MIVLKTNPVRQTSSASAPSFLLAFLAASVSSRTIHTALIHHRGCNSHRLSIVATLFPNSSGEPTINFCRLQSSINKPYPAPLPVSLCLQRRLLPHPTALRHHRLIVLAQKMTSSLTPHAASTKKHKVTVIGSGNWGSTIAKIVAENTREHGDLFEEDVQMWVYEEEVTIPKDSKHYKEGEGDKKQKLTTVINKYHENVKYLPGIALPTNVVANPSVVDAAANSTILVFNLPHQFIDKICSELRGHILPFARGISCIKGLGVSEKGVSLISESIGESLGIYCGALSGANIAPEIAQEKWSETTIGYAPPASDTSREPSRAPSPTPDGKNGASAANKDQSTAPFHHVDTRGHKTKTKLNPIPHEYPSLDQETFRILFHRPYFHVHSTQDVAGVSLAGALKNIVALAAGFVDGKGWGDNAKAAVMRIGLLEMLKFGKEFFPETVHAETFTEASAGVADLITSCMGGRNFKSAKKSVEKGISVEEVEKTDLNGQKLQGTTTAHDVYSFLKAKGKEQDYPLFTAVHGILEGKYKVDDIPKLLSG